MRGFASKDLVKQGEVTKIVDADTVTNAYQVGTIYNCERHGSVAVLLSFVKGLSTTLDFKFEFSADGGTTWYQEVTTAAPSSGVSDARPHAKTVTGANLAAGANSFILALLDTNAFNRLRVSYKGSGGTQDEDLTIECAGGAN